MRDLWIRRRRWRVLDERHGDGLTRLTAAAQHDGRVRSFVRPCEPATQARPPRSRLVPLHQALARLAGHVAQTRPAFAPVAAVTARVALHAFQLEPALAALAGRRRLLIADAVGLGKTIQAGVIASSLLADQLDGRALVIAPASLLAQWHAELTDRFGLTPRIADAAALARARSHAPYLSSPWLQPGLWLTSPDFLKQPHVIAGLPSEAWDLLVIDEAHQLAGPSQRHDVCDDLARHARQVVLLTATPHDGDTTRYARLLHLGARSAHDRLTVFRRTTRPAGAGRRTRWLRVTLSDADHRVLGLIDRFEARHRREHAGTPSALGLICAVFRRRALSSPAALRASIDRRLAAISGRGDPAERQPSLFDIDVFDTDEDVLDGRSGVETAAEQMWLRRMRGLTEGAQPGGRLRAMTALLRRSREPVIVFTQYRDSLGALCRAVPAGRRAVQLHGGLSAPEQADARAAFLSGACDTLLATDVASQGLNLQSASRWVICHDVPATPLRLEQRIGRVDRIGQRRRVHGVILTSRHPADADLRQRLEARADRADEAEVPSCARWTRTAAGLTAWFVRLRHLASRWQHAGSPGPVTTVVSRSTLRRMFGPEITAATCHVVTWASATGTVIERRLVVAAGTVADAAIAAALQHRAEALSARLRHRARRASTGAVDRPRLHQPGLFFDRDAAPDEPLPAVERQPAIVRVTSVEPVVRLVAREHAGGGPR